MSPPARIRSLCLAAALLAPWPAWAAEKNVKILFDFEKGFAFDKVEARDVTVSRQPDPAGAQSLRLSFGHKDAWPGITLYPPAKRWLLDGYAYLAMDVRNLGPAEATLCCRVDNPGGDGQKNCLTESITLRAGAGGTLKVPLRRKVVPLVGGKPVKLFGMRGFPWSMQAGRAIDLRNVTQLLVFTPRPTADHVFVIDNIRAAGTPTEFGRMPEKFFPFIDELGQYIHKDWPGKTHGPAELARHRQAEAKDLAAHPGPADRDQYGGWAKGPRLKATGFFRAEKYKGKWWLVDPEGRLFWSHGIDCVHTSAETPVDDRDGWYQWLPEPGDPIFGKLFGRQGHVVRDYYQGKRPRTFDFGTANVIRKYGKDWQSTHAALAHRRLRSWGMNTIANWSDMRIALMRKTAYVGTIHFGGKVLEGSTGYWGQFRDVFDPGFSREINARMAREKGITAGDPWCLGYFVDNELSWGRDTTLAEATLASPPSQKAKQVFLADLKSKYGTIGKLNAAWGTKHASWDALLAERRPPDRKSKAALADLLAFNARTAETYFKTIRDAVKAAAPGQMYLGCRFAWANKVAVAAAAKYCDVIGYNLYRDSVADFRMPVQADKPVIIGEFHFGALDRGMFHTGLRSRASQDDRARAYRDYVQGALRHPQIVGTGWFKYRDQSPTGRALDGENYQIGFLDICDTPYTETVSACREVGETMYAYRLEAK